MATQQRRAMITAISTITRDTLLESGAGNRLFDRQRWRICRAPIDFRPLAIF
jgi:hypothetical protein